MDLAKAKSVAIFMLLAFNIFLLFNNLPYFKSHGIRKETIENVETILESRGVTLKCSIPRTSKEIHRLKYGNGVLDRALIATKLLGKSYIAVSGDERFEYDGKKLSFPSGTKFEFTDDKPVLKVNISDESEVKKVVLEYLKDKGLLNGKYDVDNLKREKDGSVVVNCIENYEGFLVYDNYCTVTITLKGITRLEYEKLELVEFLPEKVVDFADAYQVLLARFKEGSKQVITGIDIGYKYSNDYSMNSLESVELLPVWRVKILDAPGPEYLSNNYTENEPAADLNAD